FPQTLSFNDKMCIIHEWQHEMAPKNPKHSTCAVCAHCIQDLLLEDVEPTPSLLSLLVNPYLPEHTLPNSYNISLYLQAILYCKGMCSTMSLAPLRVCPSCHCSLCGKRLTQPKNSLANFQYYGHERLLIETCQAFVNASLFDLMLVSHSRASTVTHHYSTQT
ncbi:hypothetical protein PAXRUDRAFT_77640, partial [Paxillus rubicundulus Ve08.2h10]